MSLGPQDTTTLLDHVHLFAWQRFIWHLQMARRILFTDSGFWKYSWAHLVIQWQNHADEWCSVIWGPEHHEHPTKVFGIVPYAEISPVSLNLLMMLCTVDEICKTFAIWCWGPLFLKYSTIFLRTLSQIVEPLPIFTSERLCLSKGKFTWLYTSADRCALQTTGLDCLSFSRYGVHTTWLHVKDPQPEVTHYTSWKQLCHPTTRFGP